MYNDASEKLLWFRNVMHEWCELHTRATEILMLELNVDEDELCDFLEESDDGWPKLKESVKASERGLLWYGEHDTWAILYRIAKQVFSNFETKIGPTTSKSIDSYLTAVINEPKFDLARLIEENKK